jgi:ABC-type glutathione transport system ATPase component
MTKEPAMQLQIDPSSRPRIAVEPRRSAPALDDAPVVFDTTDVEVFYGSFRAVRGVTMQVYAKQITAFIGPSGCGKTTMLRAFNRMHDVIPGARVTVRIECWVSSTRPVIVTGTSGRLRSENVRCSGDVAAPQ